jgi:hypothetical protein
MSPNANCSFETTELSLLEGSVDRYDTAPAPYYERHQASLYFPESCSAEYCQHHGHGSRPKWDRSTSFRNSRPRSKAIPVKSKTDINDLEKIQIPEGGDSIYDEATWRMYNRITYHRQKYPMKANQSAMIPRFVHVNHLPCDVVYATPIRYSDCSLRDDEIFEFEL